MQQDYDTAIADFNRALRLDPKSPDLYNARGAALFQIKEYDRAIADFDKAISLDPKYEKAFVNRGLADHSQWQLYRAIADFGVAISLAPNDPKGYLYRAMARMARMKQKPIQRSDFNEFVECYKPGRVHERLETWSEGNPEGRWRCYDYADLLKRDKLSLDLFWIKDKTLTDTDSLPPPDIIAAEIADDLEAALGTVHKDCGAAWDQAQT